LEIILSAAKNFRSRSDIKFVLLGNGPEKEPLQKLSEEFKLKNVVFLDSVQKDEMPGILKSVNACIVPLKKLELFTGAIPSKIFEALSMRLPVLLGVDGEARELFVEKGKCALYFEPENVQALIQAIEKVASDSALAKELGSNGRNYVNENFNRDTIARKFYEELKKL
jgi:glycosyltransferase involved in cell wall biosynthesis